MKDKLQRMLDYYRKLRPSLVPKKSTEVKIDENQQRTLNGLGYTNDKDEGALPTVPEDPNLPPPDPNDDPKKDGDHK
jgi:hypothetical protein